MTEIIKEETWSAGISLKKGAAGGGIAAVALLVLSFFHGLTPDQERAGLVVAVGVFEVLRNILKKNLPKFFSWF